MSAYDVYLEGIPLYRPAIRPQVSYRWASNGSDKTMVGSTGFDNIAKAGEPGWNGVVFEFRGQRSQGVLTSNDETCAVAEVPAIQNLLQNLPSVSGFLSNAQVIQYEDVGARESVDGPLSSSGSRWRTRRMSCGGFTNSTDRPSSQKRLATAKARCVFPTPQAPHK